METSQLENLMDKMQRSADLRYAAPEDVSCDVCTGRKLKAVSSCLQCLVSYCDSHLQSHRKGVVLQGHQLMAPLDKLQENLCSEHKEQRKFLCQKDQQLICSICCYVQHKGHGRMTSPDELQDTKTIWLLQNLTTKEKEMDELQREAQDIRCSAQAARQHSNDTFREKIRLMEERQIQIEQQIQVEEENQLKQVQDLQDQLQREITDLKRAISEQDTVVVNKLILLSSSLFTQPEKSRAITQIRPKIDFEDLSRAVTALKGKLQFSLDQFKNFESRQQHSEVYIKNKHIGTRLESLLLPIHAFDVKLRSYSSFFQTPRPRCRKDFLQYKCNITLNPNTANRLVSVCEDNRRATLVGRRCPDSAAGGSDRFTDCYQVLGSERLRGRCYWEVELSGQYFIDVAVSYGDIERSGSSDCRSVFGHNDKSWALCCDKNGYSFWFNGVTSKVLGPISPRIGVYLDHSSGILSYYSVKDETMTIIHKVQTSFSQDLFAGVGFGLVEDSAEFLKLE